MNSKTLTKENHPDLDKRECAHCEKVVYVITVEPADDPMATLLTTGVWAEGEDHSIVLCDDCADVLYKKGKLGFSGSGNAFLV